MSNIVFLSVLKVPAGTGDTASFNYSVLASNRAIH